MGKPFYQIVSNEWTEYLLPVVVDLGLGFIVNVITFSIS